MGIILFEKAGNSFEPKFFAGPIPLASGQASRVRGALTHSDVFVGVVIALSSGEISSNKKASNSFELKAFCGADGTRTRDLRLDRPMC